MLLEEFLRAELEDYVDKIPRPYNLTDAVNLFLFGQVSAGWSYRAAKRFTDSFPEKVCRRNNHYLWFLEHRGLKHCPRCGYVKYPAEFHANGSKYDGLSSWCISCQAANQKDNPLLWREYRAMRRARELMATPAWADNNKIREIYANCPEGYHVDHIVPLKGTLVCGLHVEYNLQYLPALDNLQKGNKYIE